MAESEQVVIAPNSPKQEMFLSTTADVAIFGGGAGGGKTWSLLIDPLRHVDNPDFRAVIFRRTSPQITNPGGLWDQSERIYSLIGGEPRKYRLEWEFPRIDGKPGTGAQIMMRHLEFDKNVYDWSGTEVTMIAFDELTGQAEFPGTGFSKFQLTYLISRNRSTSGIKPYIRCTCLAGDTVIAGADGTLRCLRDCTVDSELLSVNLHDGFAFGEKPTKTFSRKAESLRIVTTHGEQICSLDHRFFRWASDGIAEVRADELKSGDYIAGAREFPHGTKEIPVDEAYLVGYTVGDGGITGRKHIPRLMWTEHCQDHAAHIAAVAERVTGCRAGIHKRKADAFAIYSTRCSPGVARFIHEYPEVLQSAHSRHIPPSCTNGTAEAARAILQGLFDAEAHVSASRIEISVVSRVLIQQVSMMLRRWGIFARFSTYDPDPPRRRIYRLCIHGPHAAAFIKCIGFRITAKRAAAQKLLQRVSESTHGIRHGDADLVPISRKSIHHLRRFFGKSWWNKNLKIRRETADHVLSSAAIAVMDTEPLREWCAFSWERVSRITTEGIVQVYDVMMPTEHTYFAGCTVSHNCNPDADSWVAELLDWWIDEDGYPIWERSGVIRWFAVINEKWEWGDTPEEIYARFPSKKPGVDLIPKTFTFIPSLIDDNMDLTTKDPGYKANLLMQSVVDCERLLKGNWKIRKEAGTMFWRSCFEYKIEGNNGHESPVWQLHQKWCEGKRVHAIRAWDFAATEDGGDFTAGVLMVRVGQDEFYVIDVVHGQWKTADRNREFERAISRDMQNPLFDSYEVWVERESGSSGADAVEYLVNQFLQFPIKHQYSTGKKSVRADSWSNACQNRMVRIIRAPWNEKFINEHERFPPPPKSKILHDDIVDACSLAFNKLTEEGLYVTLNRPLLLITPEEQTAFQMEAEAKPLSPEQEFWDYLGKLDEQAGESGEVPFPDFF